MRSSSEGPARAGARTRLRPLRWEDLDPAEAGEGWADAAGPSGGGATAQPGSRRGAPPSVPGAGGRSGTADAAAGRLSRERAGAEAAVRAARLEAERILAAARAEADACRSAARAEGREEGLAEGRRIAEAQAGAALADAEAQRRKARAERRAALRAIEGDLAALAMELTRVVLQRELEASPEDVVALARRLLRRVEGPVRMRVHPDLAPVLEAEAGGLGRQADVAADPSVDVGGLVIEGEDGALEATVGGRLRRAAAVFGEGWSRDA